MTINNILNITYIIAIIFFIWSTVRNFKATNKAIDNFIEIDDINSRRMDRLEKRIEWLEKWLKMQNENINENIIEEQTDIEIALDLICEPVEENNNEEN